MELYEHQKRALELTKHKKRCAYYLDMGLGKTFVGSEKVKSLIQAQDVSTKVLILCQKSKIDDWINHYKEHYSEYKIFDLSVKKQLAEYIAPTNNYLVSVGVINYDKIVNRKELQTVVYNVLMLDESSLIQHMSSARTKTVLKLKSKSVVLLSGTPVNGRYENLWSQLHLLGYPYSSKIFNTQFVEFEKIKIRDRLTGDIMLVNKPIGYKNKERLDAKLKSHGAIFMKTDEAFTLPEQTFSVIKVKNSKEYQTFKKQKVVIVGGQEFVGDSLMAQMIGLRRLAGGYNKHKLQALCDLIESTNDRLIIYYQFTHDLEVIKELVGERPLSIVNGQEKDLTAYENEDNSIVLIQYQAGSMGLNLQKANKIIYFSPTLKTDEFEQSKKRIHRIGQRQACFYYQLVVKNSIEEDIYRTLALRRDYTDALFLSTM